MKFVKTGASVTLDGVGVVVSQATEIAVVDSKSLGSEN